MDTNRATEHLLDAALSTHQLPDPTVTAQLKSQLRETEMMKKKHIQPVFRSVFIAAMLLVCLTVSAVAAIRLLSPSDAVRALDASGIADAFDGPDALHIGESVTEAGFRVSLLGLAGGEGLAALDPAEVMADKTYAVVAIERIDGAITYDDAFFVSPLIGGIPPWEVNAASMGGSYAAKIIDNVLYRLVECDSIEKFADHPLYLCISDTTFYSVDAYAYDESTGVIAPRKDYDGLHALFDLPIDAAKAEPAQAEAYLDALRNPLLEEVDPDTAQLVALLDAFDPANTEPIADSVQTLTSDEKGMVSYVYEGAETVADFDSLFPEGASGYASFAASYVEDDGTLYAVYFHLDENQSLTVATYVVPQ